jgi:hypothetical protein
MVNVSKRNCKNGQEALAFVEEKLNSKFDGVGNIRIITSRSKLAKRQGIQGEEVQVRYW